MIGVRGCRALADPELTDLADLADVDADAGEKKPRMMTLANVLNRAQSCRGTTYLFMEPEHIW